MLKKMLLLMALFACCKTAEAQVQQKEADLKAAFIYNFTKYVDWDTTNAENEFIIGIIGPSAVTAPLTEIARNNLVGDKKIIIRQFSRPEDITYCNILFIPQKLSFPLHSILDKVEKKTLTISEEEGYAKRGTAFNFVIKNDKLKFESNLNVINAEGLKAGSQLLKLAILVN